MLSQVSRGWEQRREASWAVGRRLDGRVRTSPSTVACPFEAGVNLKADQAASQTQPDRVTLGSWCSRLLLSPDPLTAPHCILEQVTPPSSNPTPQDVCFFPRVADTKPHRRHSLHRRHLFLQFEARSQDQSVGRAVTGRRSLSPGFWWPQAFLGPWVASSLSPSLPRA